MRLAGRACPATLARQGSPLSRVVQAATTAPVVNEALARVGSTRAGERKAVAQAWPARMTARPAPRAKIPAQRAPSQALPRGWAASPASRAPCAPPRSLPSRCICRVTHAVLRSRSAITMSSNHRAAPTAPSLAPPTSAMARPAIGVAAAGSVVTYARSSSPVSRNTFRTTRSVSTTRPARVCISRAAPRARRPPKRIAEHLR